MRGLYILIFILSCFYTVSAQKDTGSLLSGGGELKIPASKSISLDSCRKKVLSSSGIPLGKPGVFSICQPKLKSKDNTLFYLLLVVLLFFAILRRTFARYFVDLFRFFFRTSLKANQIREQLVQSSWQSFLFNSFFVFSAAIFLALFLDSYKLFHPRPVLFVFLIVAGGIILIYTGKWCMLRIVGWLFHEPQLADMYIFIVFLVNKVMGVVLLPLLVLMAFAPPAVGEVAQLIALIIIGLLALYRFLLGYQAVFSESRLSRFHFLLYVISMEMAPMLLLYRVTVNNF